MLSSWDDYPVHQIADTIRHVGTSDRNFYDRYYFNLHGSSDELFMVMGLGQYPNLAVQDAFACVTGSCRPWMAPIIRMAAGTPQTVFPRARAGNASEAPGSPHGAAPAA